jgi:ketosteroid isomerase-like protein
MLINHVYIINYTHIETMKKLRLFKLAIILLMTTSTLSLQAQKQPKINAKQAVTTAVENLRKLMLDPNQEQLMAIASNKLSYGHSSGKVQNKQEFVASFINGDSDFTAIEFKDQTVEVSGSTAIVRHTLTGDTHDKGKEPGKANLLILLVWQKVKGQWVLLARQAVKPPVAS